MADINVAILDTSINVTSPGTQGPAGSGLVWMGAYNALTAYNLKDVVSYLGSSYVCILAGTGNLPTNGTYWNIVAQSGYSGYSGFSGQSGASTSGYSGYSGISGYSGFSGATGTTGTSGFSGYSGISGYSGYSGFSGTNGASGISGYSGFSGISGYSGLDGVAQSGISGYSGFSGISGYSGYSGFSGISGYSGYSGFSGISGYSGFSGTNGASGISGYSGFSGISGYSGLDGVAQSGISGYSGFSGISGYSGYSGFSGISGYSGYSGISGYSGFSGISGYSGIDGTNGASGISGYSGFSGISGYSGTNGTIGSDGASGFSGISGYSGFSGISGYSGYSGISGFSGFSGISGYSGYSGISGYSGYSGISGYSGSNGAFVWGASVSAGSGVGLTMTSADLGGGNAFQSSVHTASGTLTACTTTQETISTVRTYTLGSGSVTDNFIGTLFSRSNTNQTAGGTFLVQGSVVKITGTDTQTAGTLTPSYDLLALAPSLRSTGSSLNVTVANSVVTAPTNGHIYAVLGNTQTVAQTLLTLNTGTSNLSGNKAINITHLRGVGGAITINSFGSATQAVGNQVSIYGGQNYNTNSTADSYVMYWKLEQNAGTGTNTGASFDNYNTEVVLGPGTEGASFVSNQYGVGGTSITVYGGDSVNSSTNGLVNYTLSNTQSGATVVQKINTGTSAQGHTGLLVNVANASTSARGIKIDPSTTGTGYGMEFSNFGGANFRGISWTNVGNGSAGSQYGIYQGTVSGSSNSGGTTYGIYQGTVSNSASANGYGIYQDIIAGSSAIGGAGWYVANLVDASADKSIGKFFTLNNTQSAAFTTSRTANMSEIVSSITNTRTTGTKADNFNNFYVKDTTIQNGAGGTFTVTGAVAKFEVVATQTAGTLTHTKVCLSLVQDNDSTGGHILFNAYSGTPTTDGTMYFDGTNMKIRVGGATKTFTII